MWLAATTLDNADYGTLPHCRKFYRPALLSALLWDLTFFVFYANPISYCLPLGYPDGYSISSIQRKLPHLQSPWFSSPMAPSFFFPPFFAPHPHNPSTCVLAVIPSALIASQQDGARVSSGVKAETRRGKSHCRVWNLSSGCGIWRQTKFSHCPDEQPPK